MNVYFVSMSEYDKTLNEKIAFKPHYVKHTLGEVISDYKMKQLRIAETEKYAHVTYFFSGEREKPFKGEDRALIPSPKVPTYDLKPEMSAYKITDKLERIAGKYDLVVLNYANGDMVGHTGNYKSTVKAVEAVDKCLGKITPLFDDYIIVADHGNAEQMFLPNGSPCTAHTLNPVPCIVVSEKVKRIRKRGFLYNIAPTILRILDLDRPKEMDKDLIRT